MSKAVLKIFFLISAWMGMGVCSAQNSELYRVGKEDVLKVSVFGKHDYKLQEECTVSQKGTITLSIMKNEIDVQGFTVDEIDQKITKILDSEYLVDPEVKIEVSQYISHKVLIIGEVKTPGEISLQKEFIPIKDLMLLTGGPIGDLSKTVIIIKGNAEKTEEPIVLSLDELLISGKRDDVIISASDIVYVLGKDKNLPINDLDSIVYVFGEIAKPGLVSYSPNMTVLRAILNAGNFTKEAAPGRTTIKRRQNKEIKTISVDMDAVISGGDKTQDVELLPGDIVYIPRAIF
jgi:polysaccharide biosynthesis/export protein